MDLFNIKCIFCGNENQEEFQTTMEAATGYSMYTILDNGYVEFKCLKCGTFGSTDENKNEGNNKLDMFEITCNNCHSKEWEYYDGQAEEDPSIYCKKCGKEQQEK